METQNIEKLKELVGEVKIAMLCTKHEEHLHGRPMATAQIDDDGNFWFFTNEYSGKADQIENNPNVLLSYSNPANNTYIAVRGVAELVEDKAKLQELYSPLVKAWFPEGLDDPKLALLKVTASEAEYWDSTSNKMVVFFKMIAAAITGDKPDVGDHGKINL